MKIMLVVGGGAIALIFAFGWWFDKTASQALTPSCNQVQAQWDQCDQLQQIVKP